MILEDFIIVAKLYKINKLQTLFISKTHTPNQNCSKPPKRRLVKNKLNVFVMKHSKIYRKLKPYLIT